MAKVLVYLPPGAMLPLSKLLSSAVTVCATLSLFVQVMVAPAVDVMGAGENDMLVILTAFEVTGGSGVDAEPLSDLEQETMNTVIRNRRPRELPTIFLEIRLLVMIGGLISGFITGY